MLYVLFTNIFERELAPLAAVQGRGLEEEGSFTKNLDSCYHKSQEGTMVPSPGCSNLVRGVP